MNRAQRQKLASVVIGELGQQPTEMQIDLHVPPHVVQLHLFQRERAVGHHAADARIDGRRAQGGGRPAADAQQPDALRIGIRRAWPDTRRLPARRPARSA